MALVEKAQGHFYAALDKVVIDQQVRNGIIFTIYFTQDVESKVRAFERVDLAQKYEKKGFFGFKKKEEKPPLSEPFRILSVLLKSTQVKSNSVKIEVNLTFKQRYGRMISGGSYDYMQGHDEGYMVHVRSQNDDSCTIPIIARMLREMKFGCHVSSHTIDGFLNFSNPTPKGEEKIMRDIIQKVLSTFKAEKEKVST